MSYWRRKGIISFNTTKTITTTGDNGGTNSYFIYRGATYNTPSQTITVNTGDVITLTIYAASLTTGGIITINGVQVAGGSAGTFTYNYTVKDKDMTIQFYDNRTHGYSQNFGQIALRES